MGPRFVAIVFAAALAAGCAPYRESLARAERAFDQNAHERALAMLRDLEIDLGRLRPEEQARYAYLRGMTDYRIGYRIEARYWLGRAAAMSDSKRNGLPNGWRGRIDKALAALNDEIYDKGYEGLRDDRRRGGGEAAPAASAPRSGD